MLMQDTSETSERSLELPPLPKCILVDSSFRSRTSIAKDIATAGLFSEIVEAKSLLDALRRLTAEEFDACVIGSTVAPTRAIAFAKESRRMEHCGKMAVILVARNPEETNSIRLASGAHGVIAAPYKKDDFIDEIVRAVMKADSSSKWSKFLASAGERYREFIQTFRPEDPKTDVQVLNYGQTEAEQSLLKAVKPAVSRGSGIYFTVGEPMASNGKKEGPISGSYDLNSLVLKMCEDSIAEIGDLAEGYRSGRYSVDENGKPSDETVLAIQKIVARLFMSFKKSSKIVEFEQFMQFSLLEWIVDMSRMPEEEATQTFRKNLHSFK